MANYYGTARSNYFKVKDAEKFEKALGEVDGIVIRKRDDTHTILVANDDSGAWPSFVWDADTGEETEINIPRMVSEHLVDDEVAIFMEAGAEKLRYIIGYAIAINSEGDTVDLTLNNIYNMAEELTDRPDDITRAEY